MTVATVAVTGVSVSWFRLISLRAPLFKNYLVNDEGTSEYMIIRHAKECILPFFKITHFEMSVYLFQGGNDFLTRITFISYC